MANLTDMMKEKEEYYALLTQLSMGNPEDIDQSLAMYQGVLDIINNPNDVDTRREVEEYYGAPISEVVECFKWFTVLHSVIIPFQQCLTHILKNKKPFGFLHDDITCFGEQTRDAIDQGMDASVIKDCLYDYYSDTCLSATDNRKDLDSGSLRQFSSALVEIISGFSENKSEVEKLRSTKDFTIKALILFTRCYYSMGDDFSEKEKEILGGMLDNELVKEFVADYRDKTKINLASITFTLDKDLFSKQPVHDKEQYIGIIKNERKNPEALENMINYLAAEGFIGDDLVVKSTFAFRLTGRKLPCLADELQTITWRKSPNNLYHICKVLYGKNYDKLQTFFNAVDDKHKLDLKQYSSYADKADKNFVENMKIWFNYK